MEFGPSDPLVGIELLDYCDYIIEQEIDAHHEGTCSLGPLGWVRRRKREEEDSTDPTFARYRPRSFRIHHSQNDFVRAYCCSCERMSL